MKREILCLSCVDRRRKYRLENGPKDGLGFALVYPDEHIKQVRAKSSRSMLCNSCSIEIGPDQVVVAQSIWAEGSGIQYYPWEGEYLDLTSEHGAMTSIDGKIVTGVS